MNNGKQITHSWILQSKIFEMKIYLKVFKCIPISVEFLRLFIKAILKYGSFFRPHFAIHSFVLCAYPHPPVSRSTNYPL